MAFCLEHNVEPFPAECATNANTQQEQQIIAYCIKRLQQVKVNTVSKSDMTGMRALHINKGLGWDRASWPLLKTIFDGARRFEGDIVVGDRLPIDEDMLKEFVPVLKENFTPANSDIVRSLTTCAENGMFRPGEVAPPKEKTVESSLYCIIKARDIKVDVWPNYRYITVALKMHKTNHDHAVEQLVAIPVPQDSHIRAPLTRHLKRVTAKQALRMDIVPGSMTVPELLACCDRPLFE